MTSRLASVISVIALLTASRSLAASEAPTVSEDVPVDAARTIDAANRGWASAVGAGAGAVFN